MRRLGLIGMLLAIVGLAIGAGGWSPAAARAPCPEHHHAMTGHAPHHAPAAAASCAACCCLVVAVADVAAGPQTPVARDAPRPSFPVRLDGRGLTIKPGHGPPREPI